MLRERVALLALVPELAPVGGRDNEVAATSRLQLDLGVTHGRFDGGTQTGCLGLVVSDDAVLDCDLHRPKLRARPGYAKGLVG